MKFISCNDLNKKQYIKLYKLFLYIKYNKNNNILKGKRILLIFNLPSTRTRIAFQVGIEKSGGKVIYINQKELQIKRGESIKDAIKYLSNYFDIIIIREKKHSLIKKISIYSKVPIINALSIKEHPCQVVNDIFTYIENYQSIKNKKIYWVGLWNNIIHSWCKIINIFKFKLFIYTTEKIKNKYKSKYKDNIYFYNIKTKTISIKKIDILITDTWKSMGDKKTDIGLYKKYFQIKKKMITKMNKKAVFFHCLPAYRGKEIEKGIINNPKSMVWKCAYNKIYVQTALIKLLLI